MSKIGKKLSLAVLACIAIVTAVCIAITITLASNHSDTQMQNQSDTGVKILQLQVTTELENLQEVHELLDVYYTQDPKTDFDALWTKKFGSDSVEFGAIYDKSGSVIWSSDNYKLADFSPSSIGDGYSGVVADSAAGITFQYAAKFNNGDTVAVLGMDVSRADAFLEEVKAETLAEVTIFQGVTRYATTVLNADGTKAVGTDMAANVAATVIEGGEVYTGQADILGQNHFVHYDPMLDINGNIVGAYFAGFSSAENDALFTSMAVTAVILACLIAVGSVVVMLFLIKRMIEKPILEANTIVHSMSEGYLGIPDSDYNFADDEIGNFVIKLEQTKHTLNSYIRDMSKILSSMAHGDFSQTTKVVYIGDFIDIENSFLLIN